MPPGLSKYRDLMPIAPSLPSKISEVYAGISTFNAVLTTLSNILGIEVNVGEVLAP